MAGKIVIVGATSGIGQAIAHHYGEAKHPLWLLGRQTDYRRSEIRAVATAILADVCNEWVDGRGFPWQIGRDQPGLQGTEMFLAVVFIAADLLGESAGLSFVPRGVHRLEPATTI